MSDAQIVCLSLAGVVIFIAFCVAVGIFCQNRWGQKRETVGQAAPAIQAALPGGAFPANSLVKLALTDSSSTLLVDTRQPVPAPALAAATTSAAPAAINFAPVFNMGGAVAAPAAPGAPAPGFPTITFAQPGGAGTMVQVTVSATASGCLLFVNSGAGYPAVGTPVPAVGGTFNVTIPAPAPAPATAYKAYAAVAGVVGLETPVSNFT